MLVVSDNATSIDLLLCSAAYEVNPLQEDAAQLELV